MKVKVTKGPNARRTKGKKLKAKLNNPPKKVIKLTKQNKRAIIKRNKTAWIYFCNVVRPKIVSDEPDLPFGDICKRLAVIWRTLTPEARSTYNKMAEADKERYIRNTKELTDIQRKFLKRYKKLKREKRKAFPKLALSPYMFFVIDKRSEIVQSNPQGTRFEDIGRLLGDKWHSLDTQSRMPYVNKSETDKKRYQSELSSYMEQMSRKKQSVV